MAFTAKMNIVGHLNIVGCLLKRRPTKETKFERNSSLGYYHMTCYWENKTYKLKRSILLWVLAKMIVIVTEASYQMLQVL